MDLFNKTWSLEDDKDDEYYFVSHCSRSACVFLIDKQVRQLADVSNACSCILQESLISNPKNMIGCILIGNADVSVVLDLVVPSIEAVSKVESIAQYQEKAEIIDKHAGQLNLNEGFWTCLRLLNSVNSQIYSRRVILFTDMDDPYPRSRGDATSSIRRRQVLQRSKDLFDAGIKIDVIPCGFLVDFKFHVFYQHIMYKSDDELQAFVEDMSLESLSERVRFRTQPLRASVSNGRFIVGRGGREEFDKSDNPDTRYNYNYPGFNLYRFAQITNLPPKVRVDRKTNLEVKIRTRQVISTESDSSVGVGPGDVEYEVDVLGTKAILSHEEYNSLFNGMAMK